MINALYAMKIFFSKIRNIFKDNNEFKNAMIISGCDSSILNDKVVDDLNNILNKAEITDNLSEKKIGFIRNDKESFLDLRLNRKLNHNIKIFNKKEEINLNEFDYIICTKEFTNDFSNALLILFSEKPGECLEYILKNPSKKIFGIYKQKSKFSLKKFTTECLLAQIKKYKNPITNEKKQEKNLNDSDLLHSISGGNLKYSDMLQILKGMKKLLDNPMFANLFQQKQQNLDIFTKLISYQYLIESMTKNEQNNPELIKDLSRKNRICKGSGLSIKELDALINFFEMLKTYGKGMTPDKIMQQAMQMQSMMKN